MDISTEKSFDCMCRTCMHEEVEALSFDHNTKPEHQWHSILDTIEECGALPITELLLSAVPTIDMELKDDLPKKICCKCVEELQQIYRFQQMCLQSEQQMRELIAKTKKENERYKTEEAGEHKRSQKEIATLLEEGKAQIIEFASVNTLPEATQSSTAADPLQSNDEIKVENCKDSEAENDHYFEYSDDETALSTAIIKNEIALLEAEEQPVSLNASANVCHICNKSFKEPRYLGYHLKRHKEWKEQNKLSEDNYRYKCDICERFFHKPETLLKHRLAHDAIADNKPRIYTCEPCNKTWKSRNSFRLHKQHWHSESSKKTFKKYPCEICGRNFKTSTALKEHLSTHTGKRPHLCPDCGKSFNRLSCQMERGCKRELAENEQQNFLNLTQHRFRHSDVLAFECPHCPKKFRTKNDVSKHKVIHQEIKKHVCDLCGDRFVKTHQLTVHKRRHNGVKPHKCDYCDMRFLNRNGKRTHMRTHTGEKPYKCKYCERAFSQSGDHIKHLRTHIGENVYRCELCPLAFRLASELRVHFATHKNDDEETRERNMKALKEEEAKLQIQLVEKADASKFIAGGSVHETHN